MSKNPSLRQPTGLLSVGNVVSLGLRIYRDHFKLYFSLAIAALLWGLIPIYGWAKACQIQAIISRQVYKELIKEPEPISTTRTQINQRFWSYLSAQTISTFMAFLVFVFTYIVLSIIAFFPSQIIAGFPLQNSTANMIITIIDLVVILIATISYIWLYSHSFVGELALALEKNMNSTNCIGRSWQLTKGFISRIQVIIVIADLITLPIVLLLLFPIYFVIPVVMNYSEPDIFLALMFLMFFSGIILANVGATLMMPFWQAIKAVIYYNIRKRMAALGLQVQDSRPQ